ncbi:hypothetical protein [Streptomyces sp. NPDC048277]
MESPARRERRGQCGRGPLEAHELRRLRGADLDAYIEHMRPPNGKMPLP